MKHWTRLVFPALAVFLIAQEPEAALEGRHKQMKRGKEMSRQMGILEGKPKTGDAAVDFDLPYAGGKTGRVRLGDFAGKRPVALVFGSFT